VTAPTVIYSNNQRSITMGLHPSNKPATRHIDMQQHFLREHVELKNVTTHYIRTDAMVVDCIDLHDKANTETNAHSAFRNDFWKQKFRFADETNRQIGRVITHNNTRITYHVLQMVDTGCSRTTTGI